jgi:hypothetical protein
MNATLAPSIAPWSTYDRGRTYCTEASALRIPPGRCPGLISVPTPSGQPAATVLWTPEVRDGEVHLWHSRIDGIRYEIFND